MNTKALPAVIQTPESKREIGVFFRAHDVAMRRGFFHDWLRSGFGFFFDFFREWRGLRSFYHFRFGNFFHDGREENSFFRRGRLRFRQRGGGRHAVDQREQGNAGGGIALGLLDAGEFAVNFRERWLLAQGQLLAGAGAQGDQDVVGVYGVERAGGREGGLLAGDFGDEPRDRERAQDGLREPAGNAEFRRELRDGRGAEPVLKTLAE